MHFVRGLTGLIAAVALVLVGGVLVFTAQAASPPPSELISRARDFTRDAQTVVYRAQETVTVPSGVGTQLVRHRSVSGASSLRSATDIQVTDGTSVFEYRISSPTSGLWVRVGLPTKPVELAKWVHAADYAGFEAAELGGASRADPAAVVDAMFADRVVDGQLFASLLAAARVPTRRGSSVRHLDVTFDPNVAFGTEGGRIDALSGDVVLDRHNRPAQIGLHLRSNPASIDVFYTLTWGGPVTVSPPPSADVAASV